MIIGLGDRPLGQQLRADVLVIGSGAAGIPAAIELEQAGLRVLVAESGSRRNDRAAQELSVGDVLNKQHGPLHRYRVRGLGGTTSVWGGRAAPFDDIDFEARQYAGGRGWPIGRADLDPYYETAHRYLRLGAFDYRAEHVLGLFAASSAVQRMRSFHADMLWRFSEPVDLGRKWRNHLAMSQKVTVMEGMTATRLILDDNGERVSKAVLQGLDGRRYEVSADSFLLAAGGLESTRLLLNSKNERYPTGLGNSSGMLGRYYMSHLSGTLGPFRWKAERHLPGERYERDAVGVYVRRTLSLRASVQRQRGLLNYRAVVSIPSLSDPSHHSAVLSSAFLAKRFLLGRIPPEFDAKYSSDDTPDLKWKHIQNVGSNLPELVQFGPWWLARRILPRRKIPSMEPRTREEFFLHFDAEQTPRWESSITLGEGKDSLGVPRLRVDWRVHESDINSLAESYDLLRNDLEAAGIACAVESREEVADRVSAQIGVGSHHIGTTRMSVRPEDGVVDPSCRVHGLMNLYVASSSVFPSAGVANPTLTITALAVRTARHIRVAQGRS